MLKLGFNIVANTSSLWVRVLISNYRIKEGIPDFKEGLWNLDLLKVWLPDDIIIRIVSIPSPYAFARPDRIDWFKSGSGPQRIQMFIWLALKQRLLTQVERVIRGIWEEECCTVYKLASEDVIHVIRDCSMAKGVWSQIIPIDKQCNSNYKIDNIRRLKSWRTSCRTDIWTCLYSDGTVKVIARNAVVGGVIRDHHRDDFALLQSRQYDKVLIWTNNMEVLQDIEEAFSKTSYSTLIRRIQQLLLEIGQCEFEHIPKEENIEVDYITKLAFDKNEGLQLFVDNLLNFTS
ncbi:hypothetical protein Goari_014565 [Gossypium aridum]|uniref:Reverse transcriptase zinc-binding domain-containing protein n=1 Tax=Gossypium aridum TaxID=34290 RepID=A0A7J8XIJ0_GOSAI|nr:hypothetical protein [Gossypium aridum]